MVFTRLRIATGIALLFWLPIAIPAAETFRIATYNVENYLDVASGTRPVKSDQARAKVRETFLFITCKAILLSQVS